MHFGMALLVVVLNTQILAALVSRLWTQSNCWLRKVFVCGCIAVGRWRHCGFAQKYKLYLNTDASNYVVMRVWA